jgi:hypothetical protein
VAKHPPALGVIPVLIPQIFLLSRSLFVFVQLAGLQTTLPSLKNLKVPLYESVDTILRKSEFLTAYWHIVSTSSQQL